MRFDVNFQNRRSIDFHIDNNLVSTTHIEVPVEQIIGLLHDIADDFDMLKPQDKMTYNSRLNEFRENMMPKLNALYNSICRDCDNLDYYSGYFCSLKPYFSIDKIECKDFVKRKVCVENDEVKDCQFWCSGNHHSAPMEPCPLLDAKP